MAATPKKRGCLGCSFPVFILVFVVVIAIFVLGFLAGPIGSKLFGEQSWLQWMSVHEPEMHLKAPVLFHVFGLPITNTILAGWLTVVFLVLFSWLITRKIKLVPGRLQTVFEFMLGWIFDFCKSVAGEENGRKFFPVICSIFLFVLFNGWLSLVPIFGSITIGVNGQEHEFFRGANTDINTGLALAVFSFLFVGFWGLKILGLGWVKQYFNFGPLFHSLGQITKGKFSLMGIFSGFVGIFVGILEFFSMLIRLVSFTFRLFGNMTAGEILLLIAAYLIPWTVALPFYGLELLVGVIQGLIFGGLTLVFATLAVTPHEAEGH